MPTVRQALVQDVDILEELLQIAKKEIIDARGGELYLLTEIRKDFSTLSIDLENPKYCHIVGVYEDAVVGWGFATEEEIPNGTTIGKVRELFVQPEVRGIGVGEIILSTLIDWAKKQKCDAIEGTALPGDRDFKGIFERFEIKTRMLTVYKKL